MNTVFMVCGDNGSGNSGHVVLGLYPTMTLAVKRLAVCKSEYMAEYLYIQDVKVGPEGGDCEVYVEG